MQQDSIWVCNRRQGQSKGGSILTFGSGDRQDKVQEVDRILPVQCSGGPLFGDFSSKGGFLSCGSWSRFVLGAEGRLVELVMWPVASWASRMEGPNLVSCCCFLLLCYSSELLLDLVPATIDFSGRVARHRSIRGCASYNVGIQTWSIIVLVG